MDYRVTSGYLQNRTKANNKKRAPSQSENRKEGMSSKGDQLNWHPDAGQCRLMGTLAGESGANVEAAIKISECCYRSFTPEKTQDPSFDFRWHFWAGYFAALENCD